MVTHILSMNWLNALTIALGLVVFALSAILAVRGIRLNERRRRDEERLEHIREEMDRKSISRQLEKRGFGPSPTTREGRRPGERREHKVLAFR